MPIEAAVRATRRAISPRFAMRTDVMGVTEVLVLPLVVAVDEVGAVVERKRAPDPGAEVGAARRDAGRRREARFTARMVMLGMYKTRCRDKSCD